MRLAVQDSIRRKLDQIDACFPPERLAKSKERWRRLWHGEPLLDRCPFTFGPIQHDYYQPDTTPQSVLLVLLDEIIARGALDDDFIPAFFPGCRQSTIPSMFGAREINSDGDYSCEQQRYHSLEDIDRVELHIAPGSPAQAWLHMQQAVLEMTEGRLPVHVTDMQGPADVCGKLVGYETLFTWAYEEPERYHRLMARATEAFITFWDAQCRLCGELFVNTHLFGWNWTPADAGASLSADSLVMISPDFYRACYQPYLQRIGEKYGGLAVHSCGDFSAVAPVLCATPGVRAVNAGQMTVPDLQAAGVDSRTLISAGVMLQHIEDTLQCMREHRLRVDLTIFGIWPATETGVIPPAEWTPEHRNTMQRKQQQLIMQLPTGAILPQDADVSAGLSAGLSAVASAKAEAV